MKFPFQTKASAVAATIVAILAVALLESGCSGGDDSSPPPAADSTSNSSAPTTVELSGDQLNSIKIAPLGTYAFSVEKSGIGTVDFQNRLYSDSTLSKPVYPPASGTISRMLVELGDQIQKGQTLYAIQIGSSNTLVRSPISGQVTAVNVSAGISAQPGQDPAPCSVADVSTKWLLANVPESDLPLYHSGQPVQLTVPAYSSQVFKGKVVKIYPDVDANTHRGTIRCQISDKENALRAGMLADFTIRVQKPVKSIAIPANGVVREGDGTLTAWVTTDRTHFVQRVVKIGLKEHGMDQVVDGLQAGELVVTDGAIFLDNMLQAPPSD